jgi:hypothetical protein
MWTSRVLFERCRRGRDEQRWGTGQHMSRDDLGGAIILGYMRGGCCPIVAKCLEKAMKVEFSRREFEAAAG